MKRNNSMTLGKSVRRFTVAIALAIVSLAAHAQQPPPPPDPDPHTVDPATQPFMTLAPYVLKSSNLERRAGNPSGGTRGYRPWFENGAWTGDLIEYEILESGQREPRDDIGRYPRDGAGWNVSPLWTARYSFPDFKPYDPNDGTWLCDEQDENYWKNRTIFTIKSNNIKTPFFWDMLTPNQRTVIDSRTAGDTSLDTVSDASAILNYVRGDRSLERCKQDGRFRWRYSLLGAIVNSRPVYVPPPPPDPLLPAEPDLVIVGANSGMLHGFNAANGSELWAYIPSLLLDRIGLQRQPATRPRYLMDGELRHRDIGAPGAEKHIVAGGLGAGGRGLFVLDVTNRTDPSVVTEIAGASADFIGGHSSNRIGYIHGRPTIARLPDGNGSKWYVVSGNGYASGDATNPPRASLVLIPLDGTPNPAPEFIDTDNNIPNNDNNGLSAPSLVDVTGNGIVDFAYAGDLQGNLWRFDFSNNSSKRIFAAGETKPIVVEPDIARHPVTNDGFMIYFGTGSLLSGEDVRVTNEQSAYGIWDRPLNSEHNDWFPILNANRLVTQTLKSAEVTWDIPVGSCGVTIGTKATTTARFIHNQQPLTWTGTSPDLGWQVHLPPTGERIIGHPQVRAERIQFITTNPNDMANPPPATQPAAVSQAGSWMLQLDLATGGNARRERALFDLNKDCTLSAADAAPAGETAFDGTDIAGQYPVGVNLGPYNIAQPAFARVRFDASVGSVVDGVYINALFLPPEDPPGNVVHGPLDVTTDSPNGPTHAPWPEPFKTALKDSGFSEASGPTKPYLRADGLGHRVDGHSMGYNKHHGVDYVDLFYLEPRRGRSRLDVGVKYKDGTDLKDIVLDPSNLPSGLRESRRELNRVTEVGIPANQRFIVMLTNADLSQGNEIKIGDRTWPVYAYQTMMMGHLQKLPDAFPDDLVFTLRGDHNPICPPSLGLNDEDCRNRLRITPTERIGSPDGTMGTLPGCVNNTDRYENDIGGPYETRKRILQDPPIPFMDPSGDLIPPYTPEDLYADTKYNPPSTSPNAPIDNPHATPYARPSGQPDAEPWERGYRWRNGALTVQLLAVNGLNADFTLQDADDLPEPNPLAKDGNTFNNAIEGEDIGWGGAYAKAFEVKNGAVVPIPPDPMGNTSGLLYELSMFWHWGDMARFQTRTTSGSPNLPVCYGSRDYTPSLMREFEWMTFAQYQAMTAEFVADQDLQEEYARLLAEIAAGTGDLDAKVRRLQEIISSSQNIANYHRLRHYVPNSKQLQSHKLILIDQGDWNVNLTLDGTPVEVTDVERDLLPSLGPNYQPGRRSWIDLVPE